MGYESAVINYGDSSYQSTMFDVEVPGLNLWEPA